MINEEECTVVTFKGEHSNEVLIKRPIGKVTLYLFGVKQLEWIEREDGSIGTISFFENGIVKLIQVREEGESDIAYIANDIDGSTLEYQDPETKMIVFRGQFNDSFQRHGLGNEFDRETGLITRQGIWENGECVKCLRIFNGDEMVELDPAFPNLLQYSLNPIYIGGYCIDEKTGEYLRNGQGYLIQNHVTVGIGEWEHGRLVKKQELNAGWYIQTEKPTEPEVPEPTEPEVPEPPEPEVPEPPEPVVPEPPEPVSAPAQSDDDQEDKEEEEEKEEEKQDETPEIDISQLLMHVLGEYARSQLGDDSDDSNDSDDSKDSNDSDDSDDSEDSEDSNDSDGSDDSNDSNDSDDSTSKAQKSEETSHAVTVFSTRGAEISNDHDLANLPESIEMINVKSETCNSLNVFDFSNLQNLKVINVGDECCSRVDYLFIANMPLLQRFTVGTNSFTKEMNGWKSNKQRSFHIQHCPSLEFIKIGRYSFSDYGGDFELVDLPKLAEMEIGIFDQESWNFSTSSFIIRGLPELRSIVMGDKAFGYSLHTVIEGIIGSLFQNRFT